MIQCSSGVILSAKFYSLKRWHRDLLSSSVYKIDDIAHLKQDAMFFTTEYSVIEDKTLYRTFI